MGIDEDTVAERALNFARYTLVDAGSPAWTALVSLQDGSFASGPLIVARSDLAQGQAEALATAVPDGKILLVGCERQDRHLRFTVLDRDGRRLLRRDEMQDEPIGHRGDEVL